MEKLVWALRKCLEVSSDPNLAGLSPAGVHIPADVQNETALRSHIRKSLETLYHPVGTCKMGRDDMAVVDPGLRVHGIAGLRVADASVMPTIVSGNTNAATIMIGEKAAELILFKGAELITGSCPGKFSPYIPAISHRNIGIFCEIIKFLPKFTLCVSFTLWLIATTNNRFHYEMAIAYSVYLPSGDVLRSVADLVSRLHQGIRHCNGGDHDGCGFWQ
jgi:hypothetical protein